MNRDDALTAIRPVLKLDESGSRVLEVFQSDCLLPILEFQTDALAALAGAYLDLLGPDIDLRELLRNKSLRDKLIGMVIGHLTSSELEFYLDHQKKLNRRLVDLLQRRIELELGITPAVGDQTSPFSSR